MRAHELLGGRVRAQAGFSLVEMLSTVVVIGIMSGIMVKVFTNVKRQSSEIVATEVMEAVNLGVKKYSQSIYDVPTAADADSSADEITVVGLLQTRDDTVPGTPFLRPDWNPDPSSSKDDYRIRWAGKTFELLLPGDEGVGINIDFLAADYD